jgi:hypothetical protein
MLLAKIELARVLDARDRHRDTAHNETRKMLAYDPALDCPVCGEAHWEFNRSKGDGLICQECGHAV